MAMVPARRQGARLTSGNRLAELRAIDVQSEGLMCRRRADRREAAGRAGHPGCGIGVPVFTLSR